MLLYNTASVALTNTDEYLPELPALQLNIIPFLDEAPLSHTPPASSHTCTAYKLHPQPASSTWWEISVREQGACMQGILEHGQEGREASCGSKDGDDPPLTT